MNCQSCGEAIEKNAVPMTHFSGSEVHIHYYHYECHARMVLGGLNHQKRTCKCFGGTDDPDPPEMTKRQAALAAFDYFNSKIK